MIDATGRPQSVLVLGGASEIARAVVAGLVPGRCRTVILAGRPSGRLDDAATAAKEAGADVVETVDFDTTDLAGAPAAVDAVFERFGDIDLVLAAAGVLGDQAALERDPQAAADVITTNFTGLAAALLATAARMRAQGHGRIVVLSSVAGYRVRAANFVYGAAKAGLDGFALGLGDALVGSGVSVMVVRPGFVRTKMTAGRKATPFASDAPEVADAVVRGLETGAEVVWVPSVLRYVFGILRLVPRSLWRRIPG